MPLDGGSSAPSMYSSVLFPLPDGPIIDTAEPGGKESETSETIRRGPAGVGYSFEIFSTFSKLYLQAKLDRICRIFQDLQDSILSILRNLFNPVQWLYCQTKAALLESVNSR